MLIPKNVVADTTSLCLLQPLYYKNYKNASFWGGPIIMQFIDFLGIYPSTKMAITPLLVDQIEKFQCLELFTAQGLSPGVLRSHVAHVTCPQTCLEVSQLYM